MVDKLSIYPLEPAAISQLPEVLCRSYTIVEVVQVHLIDINVTISFDTWWAAFVDFNTTPSQCLVYIMKILLECVNIIHLWI